MWGLVRLCVCGVWTVFVRDRSWFSMHGRLGVNRCSHSPLVGSGDCSGLAQKTRLNCLAEPEYMARRLL